MRPEREESNALRGRLDRLETQVEDIKEMVAGFGEEIRTRQLVVVDELDRPRIVGEVFADVAELRLELPGIHNEAGPELLLFAVARTLPRPIDLGPAIGLQLREGGKAVFELEAWPDSDHVWRPHVHIGAT